MENITTINIVGTSNLNQCHDKTGLHSSEEWKYHLIKIRCWNSVHIFEELFCKDTSHIDMTKYLWSFLQINATKTRSLFLDLLASNTRTLMLDTCCVSLRMEKRCHQRANAKWSFCVQNCRSPLIKSKIVKIIRILRLSYCCHNIRMKNNTIVGKNPRKFSLRYIRVNSFKNEYISISPIMEDQLLH